MTLPQSTTTLTKSADKVITEKTTLPALTSTAYKTTVMSLEDTISTIPHIPTTKTTIVKSTATVFTTSTKTSKGEQLAQPKTSLPGCFSLKKRVEWRSMANPLH